MRTTRLIYFVCMGLFIAFVVFMVMPAWVTMPNREADTSDYVEIRQLFADPQVHHKTIFDYDIASASSNHCPPLEEQARRALADHRLTIREVHDLRVTARQLVSASNSAWAKNTAFTAAGLKPLDNHTANCNVDTYWL